MIKILTKPHTGESHTRASKYFVETAEITISQITVESQINTRHSTRTALDHSTSPIDFYPCL